MNRRVFFLDAAKGFLSALVMFVILMSLFINANVASGSMESTLNIGDRLLCFRHAYVLSSPKRGDIILFKLPEDNRLLIKRVIAIPEDEVEIKEGEVLINGELHVEDYVTGETVCLSEYQHVILGDNEYFVMGDNREHSTDSRVFGPINSSYIKAKLLFSYSTSQFLMVVGVSFAVLFSVYFLKKRLELWRKRL